MPDDREARWRERSVTGYTDVSHQPEVHRMLLAIDVVATDSGLDAEDWRGVKHALWDLIDGGRLATPSGIHGLRMVSISDSTEPAERSLL